MNHDWHVTNIQVLSICEYSFFCKRKDANLTDPQDQLNDLLFSATIVEKDYFRDFEPPENESLYYPAKSSETMHLAFKCPIDGTGTWRETFHPRLYENIGIELAYAPHEVSFKMLDRKETIAFNPDKLMTYENDFREAILAMHHMPDVPIQVDEDFYYYFLEVLPPMAMNVRLEYPEAIRNAIPGCPASRGIHFLTGEGSHKAGLQEGDRYYLMGVSGSVIVKTAKPMTADQLYAKY